MEETDRFAIFVCHVEFMIWTVDRTFEDMSILWTNKAYTVMSL